VFVACQTFTAVTNVWHVTIFLSYESEYNHLLGVRCRLLEIWMNEWMSRAHQWPSSSSSSCRLLKAERTQFIRSFRVAHNPTIRWTHFSQLTDVHCCKSSASDRGAYIVKNTSLLLLQSPILPCGLHNTPIRIHANGQSALMDGYSAAFIERVTYASIRTKHLSNSYTNVFVDIDRLLQASHSVSTHVLHPL